MLLLSRAEVLALTLVFGSSHAFAASYKIQEAIDIKTLKTTTGQTIVLTGVDHLDDTDVNEKGVQFLNGLVKGREVMLEDALPKKKRADVIHAYVWYEVFDQSHLVQEMNLPRFYFTEKRKNRYKKDGTFVFLNATIIKSGFAKPTEIPTDPKNFQLFKSLYDQVQSENPPFCQEK